MLRWWDGTAWTTHTQPQPPPTRGPGSGVNTWAVWLGVLGVFAVAYVVLHLWVYRNCFFTPSIGAWPSACI
jgi:hypothetical protein